MLNMVMIKEGDFYYPVPMHEFSRYWLPHLDVLEVTKLPNDIPQVSKMAALKRGKGYATNQRT